jgi:LysR family transcriptional regulator, benzoate and cis,cis-muconate-responsive activator of ben and cat genes
LSEARDLLKHADEVLQRVRAGAVNVRLRVGYAPSLATGLLSEAVEIFAQKHPQARVEIFDLSTKEMLAGLENDTLDVALTVGVERDGHGLKWTPLTRVSWQLAVNRQHPLAKRASVTAEEVASEPLLVFCQKDYPEYWESVTGWLREHRQRPSIAGEYDGVNSLLSAVESGLGVALVTSSTARLVPERVRLKALAAGPKPLCIAAGYRASQAGEKALAVFIEELRTASKALE